MQKQLEVTPGTGAPGSIGSNNAAALAAKAKSKSALSNIDSLLAQEPTQETTREISVDEFERGLMNSTDFAQVFNIIGSCSC
jgi:hypothetical protein